MESNYINIIPEGETKTYNASQNDSGRTIRSELFEMPMAYTLDGSENIRLRYRKPDGSEKTLDITNTGSTYVDLITAEDTCDLAGVNHCEMKVTEDGEDLGSGNFDMKVEEDAYGEAGVTVETASGPIASFETDIKDDLIECVCDINPVQDLHGEDKPYPAGGGVNIWDEEWENGGISESDGSTFPNPNTIRSKNYIPCTPSTNFYYYCGSGDLAFRICYYDSNKNFISSEVIVPANRVYQTPANCAFIKFGMRDTYGTTYKNDISINNPSTDHDYHPYENVCPIEGHTEMDIIRSGVNLFDEDNLVIANYPYPSMTFDKATFLKTGVYMASISNIKNATSWRFGYRFFDKGGNIIKNAITTGLASFESGMQFSDAYDSNQTCLQAGDTTATTVKVTITKDCYLVACISNGDVGASTSLDYQIEKGSTASAYHPAEIIEKNIQLGQTVYRARINITTGQGIIDQAGIDLGSLNWEKKPTTSGKWRFVADITNAKRTENVRATPDAICTKYAPVSPLDTWNGINGFTIDWESDRSFICDLNIEDATAFNNAMNGILMVYELKNPVSIQLTPKQIETLLGQKNNIYHTANGDTAVKFYTRA